jgi:hypothetical protein
MQKITQNLRKTSFFAVYNPFHHLKNTQVAFSTLTEHGENKSAFCIVVFRIIGTVDCI